MLHSYTAQEFRNQIPGKIQHVMAMRMRILRKGCLFSCTTWWLGSYTRQLVALQGEVTLSAMNPWQQASQRL